MSVEQEGLTLLEVFIGHRAQLRNLAKKVLGSADLAEEIVQDAYLRLAEGGGEGVRIERPYHYCCQVVRNLALDCLRRSTVEARIRVQTEDGEPPEVPAEDASIEDRIDGWRLIKAIDEVLSTLPPRTRHAFELFRLGDLTQREIGAQLGVSATLVNFMVRDARIALEALKDRRDLFGA